VVDTSHTPDSAFEFLEKLAQALAPLGQTSGELKTMLLECAGGLGLHADIFVLSTVVQITVRGPAGSTTAFIAIDEQSVDLRRLDQLQRIAVDVRDGRASAQVGIARIDALLARPPLRSRWLVILAGGLQGFAFALLLGGDMHEVVVAVPTGIIVGTFLLWARSGDRLRGVLALAGSFIAMCVGMLFGWVFKQFDPFIVALAASVQFLPGMRLAMGVAEVSAGDLVSGVTRLAGAVLTLIYIGTGMIGGAYLFIELAIGPQLHVSPGAEWEVIGAAIVVAALSYWILENAAWRDIGWMVLAVLVASGSSRLGTHYLGAAIGIGIASVLVGVSGNLFSRYLSRPNATMIVPGLMVLVPGALGVRGTIDLIELGPERAAAGLLNVGMYAIAVVIGLSIAEAVVPPRALPQVVAPVPSRRPI
jgi:uncharacterized membrane protein YjjP (DUF1212 family)